MVLSVTRAQYEGLRFTPEGAYSLYLRQDPFEKRKLANIQLQNSVLKGGKVYSELKKPFDILADGVEEERRLIAEKVPFSARNEKWLPGAV